MIGIGVATATAGIIVGGITLTGLGLRMTEFVEFVSQGNVMVMLLFIAFVCLVLGPRRADHRQLRAGGHADGAGGGGARRAERARSSR